MQLTPDFSIFYQVAIFLIVWIGLRTLVFEPTQQVLEDRRRRTIEAEHSAEAMIAGTEADRARYDAAVHERRLELQREAEAARHGAIEESNRTIAAARAAIAQELAAHRAQVGAQVDAARRALQAEADTIADEMLRRVMGAGHA
jgi:F-type H+-transporting ATPase subunit b